jgi:hypothetical protein
LRKDVKDLAKSGYRIISYENTKNLNQPSIFIFGDRNVSKSLHFQFFKFFFSFWRNFASINSCIKHVAELQKIIIKKIFSMASQL